MSCGEDPAGERGYNAFDLILTTAVRLAAFPTKKSPAEAGLKGVKAELYEAQQRLGLRRSRKKKPRR
jgi:hypothetical protein